MINAVDQTKYLPILLATAMLFLASPLSAQVPNVKDAPVGQFFADATLFSYQPGQELTTYRNHGSGGAGPRGTLGLGIAQANREFDLRVIGELKAQKFSVTVKVTPDKQDTQTHALETKFDLSDLTPRSVEIARDADGRVYKLNIVPRIVPFPQPKQLKVNDFRLESWNFQSSPVILNDQDYLGQLGMSGGPLAYCDIPGLAKIEFSLLHLKDALPLGTLADGILTISHESGTTLRISNITNGTNGEILRGGPYQVWVRWNKPSQSVEEFRQTLKQQITMLQEKSKTGDLTLPPGTLERLEKMAESGHANMVSSGIRQATPEDIVTPAE